MQYRKVGFQAAVEILKPFQLPAAHENPKDYFPEVGKMVDVTENPPFKSTYEKYKVASPWLTAPGLTQTTLHRYGYSNIQTRPGGRRTAAP
jgi:hypothetical protein